MGPSAVEWTTEDYTYLREFAMERRPWAISASSPRENLSPGLSVADAFQYGARAIQASGGPSAESGTPGMSEDCLFLNIWTPGIDSKKRPVMVWLHGGGFSSGSGGDAITEGGNLARKGDVVVVSINHRLNVFGYLQLSKEWGPEYVSSGQAGMLDIVLSLEWVRDNIARFGGNPGNVTIFGESGGARKVPMLMAMPPAKGLFHKAIIQSGSGLDAPSSAEAISLGRELLKKLGIAEGDREALKRASTQAIFDAQPAMHSSRFARGAADNADRRLRPMRRWNCSSTKAVHAGRAADFRQDPCTHRFQQG